jgi:hypothetical protein
MEPQMYLVFTLQAYIYKKYPDLLKYKSEDDALVVYESLNEPDVQKGDNFILYSLYSLTKKQFFEELNKHLNQE